MEVKNDLVAFLFMRQEQTRNVLHQLLLALLLLSGSACCLLLGILNVLVKSHGGGFGALLFLFFCVWLESHLQLKWLNVFGDLLCICIFFVLIFMLTLFFLVFSAIRRRRRLLNNDSWRLLYLNLIVIGFALVVIVWLCIFAFLWESIA